MRVSCYDSHAEVPLWDWDALTSRATFYSDSRWLEVRGEELPDGARCRYLLARDDATTSLAGLEGYYFRRAPHPLYTPASLLAELIPEERLAHLTVSPLVVGAGWSEFRGQFPVRDSLGEAEWSMAIAALAREAFGFASSAGASALAYFYLTREDAVEVAHAHADAGPVLLFHDVETTVPIGLWHDFDDYVAWLPSGRRPRAKREARAFRVSGRTIREVPLPGVVEDIAPLNSALMRKHGHAFDEERATAIYERQARALGGSSTVLLAEEAGRVVGFALRYRQRDMLYGRVAGFDYSVPNMADYFNLVFYHPIIEGAGRTTRGIHLGLGTFQAKLARGAQPTPLYSVFVGVDRPLCARPDAVRSRNRIGIAAFAEQYGNFVVGGLNCSDWMP